MKIPLSPRLLSCCDFVEKGDRVADIGCDHGYLGIYLLKNNIAGAVIAADINEGPLKCAIGNAVKFGVRDKMQFFLSDGVSQIPRDFNVLVCAGMGGDTISSILDCAPWLQDANYRLILQCQSKTPFLRQYLSQHGWHIQKETIIKDGKFLYTVMSVVFQSGVSLTPGQCYLSPALLSDASPYLSDYCAWVIKGLKIIVDNQKEKADPFIVQALQELSFLTDKEINDDNRK